MTEWNARPAARRLAKDRPELDWRVEESDDPRYTSARFIVRGYERAAPAAAPAAPAPEPLLAQPTPADLKAKAAREAKAPELDRKAQVDREVEGFQLQMQTEERRTDTTADLFAAPPPAAPPADPRGPQDRNGLRAEDRLMGNVRAAGAELSGQIMAEAGQDDFVAAELPGVVQRWAAEVKVPADDLREDVVRRLREGDKFKGRAEAIKALQPTTAAAKRDRETIALRKRLSVLKSLEKCLLS
jgi:hypothetical protein